MTRDAHSEPIFVPSSVPHNLLRGLPVPARIGLDFAAKAQTGRLDIRVPDGRYFVIERSDEGPQAEVLIKDWNFIRRFFRHGDIGIAEGYIAGEWSSPDVTTFLEFFVTNRDSVGGTIIKHPIYRFIQGVRHWLNSNTKSGSKRNIAAHYDLGNDFYESWLDATMTYSSALYQTGANDLVTAQRAKYRALAEATDIQPDHEVLEIGCGFGGFAEFVARDIGAKVTALTISQKQFEYASERIQKAGLNDRVEIVMRDYRDEQGSYDRIASIEMFEAVGEKYWPVYFQKIADCLKSQGRAGLQIITVQDQYFDDYQRSPDFIQRYIFPGGMLPPPGRLNAISASVGLKFAGERIFGQDYARTLAEWRERFWEAWPRIKPLGFDDQFKRLWEFYFHYCEAGFRSEHIDVRQMIYTKTG